MSMSARWAAALRRWSRLMGSVAGALAAVVTLLVLGAGVARAAYTTSGSGPAVGVDPTNHAQVVFWRGVGGDIWETYYYTQWRGPVDVTRRYGLGHTRTAPSVAVADDDQQYVFWRGTGGHIHEAHHATRWTTYSFPSWGTATSAPAVGVNPRTNHQYVFWRGSDGHIHEAYYTGRWHCCRDFTAWGKTDWAPSVDVADDGQQYVFWAMPGGFIREAHHAGAWGSVRTFLGWRTIAAPTVGVDPVNHDQYIFWRNGHDRIVETWYPASHHGWWSPHTMKSWAPSSGSPSVAVAADNQQYVFWRNLSGSVTEAHHTTAWRQYGFAAWRPALPGSTAAVTASCTARDLGVHFEKQSGAAGSQYLDFAFVNTTSHSCRLYGYPGVSALTAGGATVDFEVAHRTSQPEQPVVLEPGQTASFSLAARQVTAPCRTITAWRFIPPNDRRYEQIAHRLRVCGNQVTVSPVEYQQPPI